MIRNLFILFITTTTLLSCQSKKKFQVVGEVNNYDEGQIIIINLQSEGEKDTVQVKNGRFNYSGSVEEPTPFMLFAPEILPSQSIFYVDKGKTSISFTAKDPNSLKIKGCKTQEEYNDFYQQTKPYLGSLDSLQNPMIQTAEDFNLQGFQNRYIEVEKQLDSISNNFISQNSSSYLSALLAYLNIQSKPNLKAEEKQALLDKLDPTIQQSFFGAEIQKIVAIASNTATKIGEKAPDFTITDINNKPVKLSDYTGKYVLLDFWASWCGPCRNENPNVVAAYHKFKNKNFDILGISLDEKKEAFLNAIKKDALPWTHASDLKGWNSKVVVLYGVRSIPSNFLIDPNGKIIAKDLRAEALDEKLSEILK